MPLIKVISQAVWDTLPEIDVEEGDRLFPIVAAGTHRLILSEEASVIVPALTAGSIDQTTPNISDTITVSGSNATNTAQFNWQQSANGSSGWANISGQTAAALSPNSATAGFYVRRGVQDGVQGTIYTSAVQISENAAPTITIAFVESSYISGSIIDLSDIIVTIVGPGSPPLTIDDLNIELLVNNELVIPPHVASTGEELVGRVTASHLTGAILETTLPITVISGLPEAFAPNGWDLEADTPNAFGLTDWSLEVDTP